MSTAWSGNPTLYQSDDSEWIHTHTHSHTHSHTHTHTHTHRATHTPIQTPSHTLTHCVYWSHWTIIAELHRWFIMDMDVFCFVTWHCHVMFYYSTFYSGRAKLSVGNCWFYLIYVHRAIRFHILRYCFDTSIFIFELLCTDTDNQKSSLSL